MDVSPDDLEDSPDEVFAVAAEGGVLEEPGDELVVLHLRDVLLLQRSLPGSNQHHKFTFSISFAASIFKLQMKWKLIHLPSVHILSYLLICPHNALKSYLKISPGVRACFL